ncbi:MAG: hypothetical protein Q3993_00195 [Filifactor alocis]|nr:hypothetical protein [Filifactor alocis]
MYLDERTLPTYLQRDIEEFQKALKRNDRLDANELWCEVYGSINSAQHGYEITKEVADYLRKKYLGLE